MKLSTLLMSVLLLLALVIAPEPYQSLPHAEAATFTVTSLADSGAGTLRQAILDANGSAGADVINFSVTGTITLSSQLDVTDEVTINGSGITLDGGTATRIMTVGSFGGSTPTVILNDLIFQNGSDSSSFGGGAIENFGTLTITSSTFSDNTSDLGGAILNSGTLTITSSMFSGNQALGGGVISNLGPLTITGSTFNGNAANLYGGAIYNDLYNVVMITNSIFSNNQADYGGAIYNELDNTVTITNSTFSANTAGEGGAVYDTGGTLTITDSTFTGNMADDGGGAISTDGTLTITGSMFSDNQVDFNSSGAISTGGTATITDSTFSGNWADRNGAISNSGTLEITNSTFSGNWADDGGGAIENSGTLTITNSIFSNNQAGTFGRGGVISNYGPLTVTGSTFSSNMTGEFGGGAIYNWDSMVTITDSTFSGNTTNLGNGGAIWNLGPLEIISSTFSGNTATYDGGAIYNYRTLTITNSTLSGNTTTSGSGGAIYNRTAFGHTNITSSTFSGNQAPSAGGTLYRADGTISAVSSIIVGGDCSGIITDGGNNLSFNAAGCPGTVADPQLGPLQNNGGPTDTMLPALNSAAVDAYNAPCATATDQRGIARPQGALCDIGSTEQNSNTTLLAASGVCNGPNLDVTIAAGDGPFNITASAGVNTPVNGVSIGTTTINGPEKWDNLTVTEIGGDTQSINLGQFKCRSDERPVPVWPNHRSHTTSAFPLFSWTVISNANNYRVFVFDDANPATRTVDIRQNSGGLTSMQLSTPLPNGRLFWRTRGRQNRIWSLWSIRFTLFKDPVVPLTVNTPVPTIEPNPPPGDGSAPNPMPTLPAPPNSR